MISFQSGLDHLIDFNKDKNKPTLKASVISAFFLSSSIDLSSHTFCSPEMKKYHWIREKKIISELIAIKVFNDWIFVINLHLIAK